LLQSSGDADLLDVSVNFAQPIQNSIDLKVPRDTTPPKTARVPVTQRVAHKPRGCMEEALQWEIFFRGSFFG